MIGFSLHHNLLSLGKSRIPSPHSTLLVGNDQILILVQLILRHMIGSGRLVIISHFHHIYRGLVKKRSVVILFPVALPCHCLIGQFRDLVGIYTDQILKIL